MAGLAVPLILGLAPSVIELITALVHRAAPAAEAALGPGTGPIKFSRVFDDVMGDLTKAAELGTIPKTLPSDEEVKLVIQSVVSSLKMAGGLAASPVLAPAAPQLVTVAPGQTVTITITVKLG